MKFQGRWLPESQLYKDTCIRLSNDLTGFKVDKDYVYWVGNDNRTASVVDAFDRVVDLPYVSKNDRIGSPKLHNGKSAATLRFMKVIQELKHLPIKSIVEIGGGYGGQCLVAKEIIDVEYTIVDIPEALELSKAYLQANDVDARFISSDNVPSLYCDLMISDYCLSELDETGVDFYLSKIKSKYIHIASNSIGDRKDKFIARLRKQYHLTIVEENPKTSHHENIVIFGVAHNHL